ncbi:VOC family protein [Amycolatopsis sp. cg5]|uniref:VOC family protein n=1 Tax=Amycolatopsis sp. cg5 TaxID=3238802 RepID=UPI0035259DB9
MLDPFDALRRPPQPIEPDADFAEELLTRLREAVLRGEDMTTTEAPSRAETRSLTPYLAVSDARAALDFYVEVFGAVRRGDPIVMEDGKIGHAELAIGDSVLMLAEEHPEIGHVASTTGGASVRVEVSDVDASFGRAVELGAEVIRPVTASAYGTSGAFRDPFGQRWLVSQAAAPTAPEQKPAKHGEAMYFTFQAPDDKLAKTFYSAVLGWQFSAGRVEGAWGFEGPGLPGGLWGGQQQVGWKLMYAVDDLEAALDRVRAQGGQPGEIEHNPYGDTADCTDDQGIEFWLWRKP